MQNQSRLRHQADRDKLKADKRNSRKFNVSNALIEESKAALASKSNIPELSLIVKGKRGEIGNIREQFLM